MDSKNIVSVAFQLTLLGSLYFGPLANKFPQFGILYDPKIT